MVLFILFNYDKCSIEQWKTDQYDKSKKSSFINKLKRIGNVYEYNPIFYNFNKFNRGILNEKYSDNYKFSLDSINLENHCNKIFDDVKEIDSTFILISGSNGYIFAHTFALLYEDYVSAIININGGHSKDKIEQWLYQDKIGYISKIKNGELKKLFENLDRKYQVNETICLLNNVVMYNIFKQYLKAYNKLQQLSCDIIIFTNLISSDHLLMLDKLKFCNEISKKNTNVKIFNYLDKHQYLHFDIEKDILDIIKMFVIE
jgi:hypothetical protein